MIEKYGFNHISTGEVIRREIARCSERGCAVKQHIENGHLAPDDMVIEIIAEFVASNDQSKGNIFDGFPRTIHQAEEFDMFMEKNATPVNLMVSLEIDDDILIERLEKRGKISGRSDDNEEVVRRRIDIYKKHTAIVAEHYKKQGKYFAVDGRLSIEGVFDVICEKIDSLLIKGNAA